MSPLFVIILATKVSWQPPTISGHNLPLHYNLFYQPVGKNSTSPGKISTKTTNARLTKLDPATQWAVYATAVVRMEDGSELESWPSEEIFVWTLEAISPSVDLRVVKSNTGGSGPLGPLFGALLHGFNSFKQRPISSAIEGSTVTVLCLAQGFPIPQVELFMGGQKVSSQRTHYMAVTVSNITRQAAELMCTADNDHGIPALASTTLTIHFKPEVSQWPASSTTGTLVSRPGANVTIRCMVTGSPMPEVYLHRGQKKTIVGAMKIEESTAENNVSTFFFTLDNISPSDTDQYICVANNSLGTDSTLVQLNVTLPKTSSNVTFCCEAGNVSSACLPLCNQDVDLDWFSITSKCLSHFPKVCFEKSQMKKKHSQGDHLCLGRIRSPTLLSREGVALRGSGLVQGIRRP